MAAPEHEPAIPEIGLLGHDAEHPGTGCKGADKDRRPLRTRSAGTKLAVPGLVIRALEVRVPIAQQRPDEADSLLEATDRVVDGVAVGGELGFVPAGAKAEDEAAPADLVQGIGHLRHQRRVPKSRAGDQRPQFHALGRGREGTEE